MMMEVQDSYKVILFYRYVPIEDTSGLRGILLQKCQELSLLGRILLAKEGINGTLAGSNEKIDNFVTFMSEDNRFSAVDWKDSYGKGKLPFPVLSVKIVPEIVSSGTRGKELQNALHYDSSTFGGLAEAGRHLTAEEFHQGIDDPNCVLLDIRNQFEFDIGHFEKAVNIGTYTYAETFDRLDSLLQISPSTAAATEVHTEEGHSTDKKIYMYCTGGVRCEKASAYLRNRGFENVYHLQGGIHRYLQTYPDGGKFEGKNFVFDSRIAMGPDGETTGSDSSSGASAVSNSSSSSGSKKIVGQCIDCHINYDQYSGNIICTVCRQPVLVCETCVRENPFPNEYYCIRHRDLKGIYLTILDNKSVDELRHQRHRLQDLLDLSIKLAKEKKDEKMRHRQEHSRRRHIEELQKRQLNGALEFRHEENSTLSLTETESREDRSSSGQTNEEALINEGKHRRKTLRKQIEKLDEKIRVLEELHAVKLVAESVLPNPKARCGYGFWES